MRDEMTWKFARLASALALACLALASCTDDGSDDGAGRETAHADAVEALVELLPPDARGVFVADVASLLAGGSAEQVNALLTGGGGDPIFKEQLATMGSLARSIDVDGEVSTALVGQTTDASEGSFLLAKVNSGTVDEVVAGSMPERAGSHGTESRTVYVDDFGTHLALLPDGVLVMGSEPAVDSVIEVADGAEVNEQSPISPLLGALDPEVDLSFVYGLPALLEEVQPDRSLRGAAAMSGALDLVDGDLEGSLVFHTSNAGEFVESYNALNRHAVDGADAVEEPLVLEEPLVDDLGQVVVPLPSSPLDASFEDTLAVRNVAKKLFVGMEAHDYAEDVSSTGNAPWIDLIIKSEADGDEPASPGAVFFRWEFRDKAAMEAFAANELPPGFKVAPTQFLESDDPDGEYFLALMLYNAGGGSIVDGARAEWDVFVSPPEGADPDAPDRPRYMIIQALSAKVSGDPATLLTDASPVSYGFDGDQVVSSVGQLVDGEEVTIFESSFPKPDPSAAEPMRWTAEMAIANDYMHWPNAVHDHIVYNATTYNWEGYYVDTAQTRITDGSRWAKYMKPELKDATYYVNTLEYVASPLANLESEFLDVTPQEREELQAFKDNGHQRGIMRGEVEKLFLGTDDAYVGIRVPNETPTTFYNFEITDPEGMEEALDLPEGQQLAPTTIVEGGEEGYYLTLAVSEVEDAIEGTRATWSVYVDDGSGRPHQQVLEQMTEEVGIDPVSIVSLPSDIGHGLEGGVITTQLSSPDVTFDASFETAEATDEAPTMNWIEAGDNVCYANGVCDKYYYDAETLDVAVHRPAEVEVAEMSTPWSDFISATPTLTFFRDNAQDYAVKRWHNLKVEVELAEVGGLEDPTHAITGSGSLVGRTSTVADSTYSYTGDARVDGDELTFSLDQQVDNALGLSHIYTTGSFDLTTGEGTQTVVDCRGPALMCSDVVAGSEEPYTAQQLDASDPDAITWKVDVEVDLENFGLADSSSTFTASRR
jgi:hypothetical protein